ncbi:MAG: hypothetical protein QF512_14150 [Alphaproteobacteria bacterium]|nr:hypothetical protein [Alphaproteobacteria bacterium]
MDQRIVGDAGTMDAAIDDVETQGGEIFHCGVQVIDADDHMLERQFR